MAALSGPNEFAEFYGRLRSLKDYHRKFPNEVLSYHALIILYQPHSLLTAILHAISYCGHRVFHRFIGINPLHIICHLKCPKLS